MHVYACLALLSAYGQTPPQSGPEEAAAAMLDGARRGYNEQKYDFAAERFKEYIKQFPNSRDIPAAQYGLALCLLNGPKKDLPAVLQALQPMASRGDLPEQGFALYYSGVASRSLGEQAIADAEAKPEQAAHLRTEAARRFDAAGQSFAAAASFFASRAKSATSQAAPENAEWSLRSRCDHTDMLLRLGRHKEAADRAAALVAEGNPPGPFVDLASYQLGHALFMCNNPVEAGRALARLAPFNKPYGNHVRFLLARIHHAAGELPEAAALYKALLTGHADTKKLAQEGLKNQNISSQQRATLQATIDAPAPDFVQRSQFYLAMLTAEIGSPTEAVGLFTTFTQQYPKSPLFAEASVRLGYCQLLSGNTADATRNLQPLLDHPTLGDRAQWWMAKTIIASADPKDQQAFAQATTRATELLRRAADTANTLSRTDPEAKSRRGDILIEVGDALQSIGDSKAAVTTYEQALRENNNPDRAEETLQREITALHFAGLYRESDDQCRRFEQQFSKSTLLPAVIFRSAENAYLSAVMLTNQAAGPNRQKEENQFLNEAIRRYRRLMERSPDFPHIDLARQGMGTAHYRLGEYNTAAKVLSEIPTADYKGPLATVPYLLADSLIRSAPPEQSDAVSAANVLARFEQAAKLLESFVAASEKSPDAPDALLKLGYSLARVAGLTTDPAERQKRLDASRKAYDQLTQRFPQHALVPAASLQRAVCTADLGDPDGAIRDLNRFQSDPFVATPVAPVALARLGALLRQRGRPSEAVNVLQQGRNRHEAALLADTERKVLAFQLQYEHAQALKEWGKVPEARAMFESMVKQFAGHPGVASAVWKAAQCRREELVAQAKASRLVESRNGAKPEDLAAAAKAIQEARNATLDAVAIVEDMAASEARRSPGSQAHQSLLYEAAWCYRTMAELLADDARRQLQDEMLGRIRMRSAGQPSQPAAPAGAPPVNAAPRWADRAAEQQYRRLIDAAPSSALGARASLELGELLMSRRDLDTAVDTLSAAVANNPPSEIGERIRLLLAFALLGKRDIKGAQLHAEAAALKPVSPLTAVSAKAVVGEAQCLSENWADAIKTLIPFRDHGPWQSLDGVTDRALLRLGQAQIRSGQNDQGCATLATLTQRFASSPWVDEALFEIGMTLQTQGKLDQAMNSYRTLTARSVSEWAARAQLQTALALRDQPAKKAEAVQAFLAVYYTYDEPELCAKACWEAAAIMTETRQEEDANRLLRRLATEFPSTTWAEQARRKLAVKP
jgi:TolA-binding protein